MRLDGRHRQVELGGDLGVAQAAADGQGDVGSRPVRRPAGPRPAPVRSSAASVRTRWISVRVTEGESIGSPAATLTDRRDDLGGRGVLEQEAVGAGRERAEARARRRRTSSARSPAAGRACVQLAGRLEPVEHRHPDVHQDRRRAAAPGQPRRPRGRRRPRRRPRGRPARPASGPAPTAPAGRRRRSGRGSRPDCSCRPRYPAAQHERRPVAVGARAGRRAARPARTARPGRARSRASPSGRSPTGLRSTTSMPSSGRAADRMLSRAPGACLRALVIPSWTIR